MNKGFTLVELAIVIVIIGLIVGGVVGGQSLIDSAKRQEIMKNLKAYETGVNAFILEYGGMPGDFNEAEDYWGGANTDNGDGDRYIESNAESIDFWNHLGLAEIVPGSFDHTATTFVGGTSTPETGEPFMYIVFHGCEVIDCNTSNSWVSNYLSSRSPVTLVGNFSSILDVEVAEFTDVISGLSNKDVKAIDKKIDNDNPINGRIMAPACTVADKDLSGGGGDFQDNTEADFGTSYVLTETDPNCFFFYEMDNYF